MSTPRLSRMRTHNVNGDECSLEAAIPIVYFVSVGHPRWLSLQEKLNIELYGKIFFCNYSETSKKSDSKNSWYVHWMDFLTNVFFVCQLEIQDGCRVMGYGVINASFNNISVILWQSDLLVEETRVPRRKPPICRKSLTNFIT